MKAHKVSAREKASRSHLESRKLTYREIDLAIDPQWEYLIKLQVKLIKIIKQF